MSWAPETTVFSQAGCDYVLFLLGGGVVCNCKYTLTPSLLVCSW